MKPLQYLNELLLMLEIDQLRAVESKHIRATQCINKNIPGRTKQQYRLENKETYSEKMKERVVCVCGANLSNATLTRHLKTAKHIAAIEVPAVFLTATV